MSGDLISREAAMALARNDINRTIDCNDIARMPAVDAEPVRHGKWTARRPESRGYTEEFLCSVCDRIVYMPYMAKECDYEYCPNCGAKIDKEGE